jgi:hypothetical protein
MIEETKAAGALAKDPASYSWLTYGWIFFLAMWGGLVRVLREMKLGEKTWKQLAFTFATEMVTSGFVGVLTFYGCEAAEIRPLVTAMMVSVSGWMGVRALSVLEAIYRARAGAIKGE